MNNLTASVFYFDSSALVKRYITEDGTSWIEALCADEENSVIAIAHLGLVEVAAAFAAKLRGQFISQIEYNRALNDLINDAQQRYQLVDLTQSLIYEAIQLTRRQKLRGYDATHLACALALNSLLKNSGLPTLTFVSADKELLIAATGESLITENPNEH